MPCKVGSFCLLSNQVKILGRGLFLEQNDGNRDKKMPFSICSLFITPLLSTSNLAIFIYASLLENLEVSDRSENGDDLL